jgi:L-alanine-DL-glutamate epimerase-like enolase superfamily enzyme
MTAAVDRIDVSAYRVPLEEPESDGTFTWTDTTVVVAELVAGDASGLGFTYGPTACATVITDILAPAVIGSSACDIPSVWREMVASVRNVGRPGIASMAIAAVDVALWDLRARQLGMPLSDLLGRAREQVAVYGSGGFTSLTDDELRRQLTGWAERGIPTVKMKVGTAWGSMPDRDVARVRAARAAIGDDVALYVDANGAYGRAQAVRMAADFADAGVTWFEEPVSSDDLAGLRHVRSRTDLDVAAGEYGYDVIYFERMCAADAVDVLQADVSRCAGITEWLRVASVAAAHGLDISCHCAQSVSVDAACAVPNIRHLEYFADHARADRLLFDGVLGPVDGALHPNRDAPGHGLSLKRADVEPLRVR